VDIERLVGQANDPAKLNIGLDAPVLLQLEGVEGLLKTKLVGMETDRYLVVNAPRAAFRMPEGYFSDKEVVVKYLFEGALYAFQTTITESIRRPHGLFFLEYPKIVSNQNLRRGRRVDCFVLAEARFGGLKRRGAVLDLSKSGCRLSLKQGGDGLLGGLCPGDQAELVFRLNDEETPRTYPGAVRRRDKKGPLMLLGVEFEQLDPRAAACLDSFVNSVLEYRANG